MSAAAAAPQYTACHDAIEDRARFLVDYLHHTEVLPAVLMRPQRVPVIGRGLALCGEGLGPAALVLLADLALAIYAVDDLADEGDLSVEEVALRLGHLAEAATGSPCAELAFDPLSRCLAGVAARLRRAPLGEALWPAYCGAMRALLSGMVAERRAGARLRDGAAPTLAEHLEVGKETVGVRQMALAAWMLLGERGALPALSLLQRAAGHLSLAARIANELHSQEREEQEGKVNALLLLGPEGGDLLRCRLRIEQRTGCELLLRRPATAARSAMFLSRFAAFFIDVELEKGRRGAAAPSPRGATRPSAPPRGSSTPPAPAETAPRRRSARAGGRTS